MVIQNFFYNIKYFFAYFHVFFEEIYFSAILVFVEYFDEFLNLANQIRSTDESVNTNKNRIKIERKLY